MEYREIMYIRTITKCKSITKAADSLYIAQPSLSQALHRVEEYYGAEFFWRTKSGLVITDAGKAYLEAADKMEKLYNDAKEELKNSPEKMGRICFGTPSAQGGVLLPDFLQRFHAAFPHVELKLCERTSVALERMVADGTLYLAMLHRPFIEHELNYISIYEEPFLLAAAAESDAPASGSESKPLQLCTAEMLAERDLILPDENMRMRGIVDRVLSLAKVTPKISYTTTNMLTALCMASKGLGVTIVPRYLANAYKDFLKFDLYRLPDSWGARWELVVAYRDNYEMPDICSSMVHILQETVASMPEIFE